MRPVPVFVDSSVWIDHFRDVQGPRPEALRDLLRDDAVLLGDLVLMEVLQGFTADRLFEQAEEELALLPLVQVGGRELAVAAASNYRFLRTKGVTVRKSIDMLIGTWCIVNRTPLLHSDRDFDALEEHLGLPVWRG